MLTYYQNIIYIFKENKIFKFNQTVINNNRVLIQNTIPNPSHPNLCFVKL